MTERIRSRGESATLGTCSGQVWSAASASCTDLQKLVKPTPSQDWSHTYLPWEKTESIRDIVTPNYFERSSRGEIINNPLWKTKYEYWLEPVYRCEKRRIYTTTNCGGVNRDVWKTGGHWIGNWEPKKYLGSSYLTTPVIDLAPLMGQATTGAFAKANESEVEGLVVLAEGNKTIASVVSILRRVIRIGKAIKKLQLQKLYREVSCKELANRWMEGRYAVRPLLYDMKGIVKAINKKPSKPRRQTYRSGASASESATQSGVLTYTEGTYGKVYSRKLVNRNVRIRSGVLCAIDELRESSFWGLDQPIDALWELFPFSFVVDWFFNVGKTIASWTPKAGIKTLASWLVIEDITLASIEGESSVLGSWTHPQIAENEYTISGGAVRKLTHLTTRVPNPSHPILPVWSVRLDAAKLLDLIIMGKRFF